MVVVDSAAALHRGQLLEFGCRIQFVTFAKDRSYLKLLFRLVVVSKRWWPLEKNICYAILVVVLIARYEARG